MKAAKIMAACLSICAVLCACAAAAAWIPAVDTIFSAGVTAGEWKADGGAAKELSFSANTDMAGYADLSQPSVAYSEEDADSPVPCDRMTAFDDDADMSYFFAGWYTEPEGGERVIHLPFRARKITEIFDGRGVAENTDTFTDSFRSPGTNIYFFK